MRGSRSAWILVGLLWVVAVLNYLDRQVIFSVFPLLEKDLKLSSVELGLLSTVFLWVYGVTSPIAGFLADRFGRRRIILASLLIWSVVTWVTGLARNSTELLWARGVMGLSESCYIPAALALIASHHGERTRSLATGLHQSGLYIGIVLGGVGGGWLGQHYGWRAPFTLLGLVGVLYFAALSLTLKERPSHTLNGPTRSAPRLFSSLGELGSLSGFLSMMAAFSIFSIGNWIVYTWLPLYLYERFHMSLTLAGFSATFYVQAASFAGIVVGGWLADRWNERTRRGRILTQVTGIMVAAPSLFLMSIAGSPIVLIPSLILFGLGRGFYDCNTMPVLCQIAREDLRATGYGVFNLAGCLAGGAMTALAGALRTVVGLGGAFQLAGVLMLVSVIVLLRIRLSEER